MSKQKSPARVKSPLRHALLASASVAVLLAAVPQQAQALTLLLNFTTTNVTEGPGGPGTSTIGQADYSNWGFTGMTLPTIMSSVLASVNQAYLMYPTVAMNAASPLPVGKELNISFETVTSGSALPSNGDAEYYYFGVGNTAGGGEDELGHAWYGGVRNLSMVAAASIGAMVGVNFTDNLQGLTNLATTDAQRINILAGTIAHEFGHALSLDHPAATLPNPGDSAFSIMATGAAPSNMPDEERLKARAFSYAEYATLIQTVGVRDVSAVPEPGTYAMLMLGLGVLVAARKRKAAQV